MSMHSGHMSPKVLGLSGLTVTLTFDLKKPNQLSFVSNCTKVVIWQNSHK